MALSLAMILPKLGAHFAIASPQGSHLAASILSQAQELAEEIGADSQAISDLKEAVVDADVISTDLWTSMGQEAKTGRRLKVFSPYQINRELLAHTGRETVVLHCWPAHRGQEITDEVADGSQSLLFEQTENRLHAQNGILALELADNNG